jgi:hypothetical protein
MTFDIGLSPVTYLLLVELDLGLRLGCTFVVQEVAHHILADRADYNPGLPDLSRSKVKKI